MRVATARTVTGCSDRRVARDPPEGQHYGHDRERDVDQECGPPPPGVDQHATEGKPGGHRHRPGQHQASQHAGGRLVHPGLFGAAAHEQHRRRIGGSCSHTDQNPRHHQSAQIDAQSAHHPTNQYGENPGQEDPPRPEFLRQFPGGRLGDRGRQVKRGDQDRCAPQRHVQRGGDRHQRGGDQGAVDRVERRTCQQGCHEPPGERGRDPQPLIGPAHQTCSVVLDGSADDLGCARRRAQPSTAIHNNGGTTAEPTCPAGRRPLAK